MNNSSFEQELARSGRLVYTNVGTSMLPMLRPRRDLLIVEPRPQGRCKRYDVVLYKRPTGQYVLHRILKVRKEDYVLCGDNRAIAEPGVQEDWIFGILTGFVRDGKTLSVNNLWYRCYVHLWCDFFVIRAGIIRLLAVIERGRQKHEKKDR